MAEILEFAAAVRPLTKQDQFRRSAAWWARRMRVKLDDFHVALDKGDIAFADRVAAEAVRFATYAGTCARHALEQ